MVHQPGQAVFRSILPEDIDWKPFPAFIGTEMVVARGTQGYDLLTTGRSRLLAELPISLQFQGGAKHSAIAFAHASEAGKLDALPRLEALQNSTGLRCRRERACLSLLDGNTLRHRRRLAS